jgi:hypothetical protein
MAFCVSPTSFRAVSTSILDSQCKNSEGEQGRPDFFHKHEQQVGFFGGMAFCVSPTAFLSELFHQDSSSTNTKNGAVSLEEWHSASHRRLSELFHQDSSSTNTKNGAQSCFNVYSRFTVQELGRRAGKA